MTTKDNEINQFLKVRVNDYHMEQYVRKGFISQEILDKIKSTKFNDVIKLNHK